MQSRGKKNLLCRWPNGRVLVVPALALLLAGCPVDIEPPGDVAFGEYLVVATIDSNECRASEEEEPTEEEGTTEEEEPTQEEGTTLEDDTFSFRARIAADVDGETAWISLASPPEAQLQPARRGSVDEEGRLVFRGEQSFPEDCGCGVLAFETITLALVTEEEEATGEEQTGEEQAGEEPTGDEEEAPEPPIPGLPHPDRVIEIEGTILYELEQLTDCAAPSEECILPCTFDYLAAGSRSS